MCLHSFSKRLVSGLISRKTFVAAAVLAAPVASQAAGFDRGRDDHWRTEYRVPERHEDRHDGKGIDVDLRIGAIRPEYATREVKVWVPATYRTVVDRQWVEPVYRTETERVWVPERTEERQVHYRDYGRDCVRIERVVVDPGHYESRERRVCVTECHWENCERQELVCEGHYESHTERVKVERRMSPLEVVNPALAGIGGITGAGR